MSPSDFHAILADLTEENPLAVRAVLRILAIEFTDQVPTLAVTAEERPRLLVNLDFVSRHCRTDAEVKAVLMHEYLHVLLRHTESNRVLTPARHLALDAIINAIIHRQLGPEYSAMMGRYYAAERGIRCLLRPLTVDERRRYGRFPASPRTANGPSWVMAWHQLYAGRLIADDVEELAETALPEMLEGVPDGLLGNHDSNADLESEPQ